MQMQLGAMDSVHWRWIIVTTVPTHFKYLKDHKRSSEQESQHSIFTYDCNYSPSAREFALSLLLLLGDMIKHRTYMEGCYWIVVKYIRGAES